MNGSCRCDVCGQRFRSLTSFDMHRTGAYARGREKHTRRCLRVEEMAAKGMRRNDHDAWTTGREFMKVAA
jgi:hypothetical protein